MCGLEIGVLTGAVLRRHSASVPDSVGYLEKHSEKGLSELGSQRIPNWESTCWCEQLIVMLVVYVDDCNLAGPVEYMQEG